MNALVFLYRHVLEVPLDEAINAVRADRKVNVPVELTREEVAQVIPMVEGVAYLYPNVNREWDWQWLLCRPYGAGGRSRPPKDKVYFIS